jgi:hypothetical protein
LLAAGNDDASLFGQSFTVVDESSRVYVGSTDGGMTWLPLSPPPPNMLLPTIVASPDGMLIAATQAGFGGPSPPPNGIYWLSPGAATWQFRAAWPVAGWR